MSDATKHIPLPYITINGQTDPALTRSMTDLTVESSLYLPDVMTLTLSDPDHEWADDENLLVPGGAVEVSFKVENGPKLPVFDGEIVEIEQVLEGGQRNLVVRAFDRLHRLTYGRYTQSFVNAKISDVLQKVIKSIGLSSQVTATTTVYDYILQSNQTNLEFVRERAAAAGLLIYAEKNKICCVKPEDPGNPVVAIEWGKELSEFRPRMSTAHQINKVTARGWDPKQKQAVVGTATSKSSVAPKNGVTRTGGAEVQRAFNLPSDMLVIDYPVRTQDVATQLATAVAEKRASSFIEAEGLTEGNPKIVAGVGIDIKKAGKKFDGKYFVTSAVHSFGPGEYTTRFIASGLHPLTVLSLMVPDEPVSIPNGLVIGIVTNNLDPDGLGRVKLKFPWLDDKIESDWARVVSVGAGIDRGVMFLPEVNDEVLVGFEMGDIQHPYVIGGLWNGQDKPPVAQDQAVKSDGKVVQRIIKTRTGHQILFEEEAGGKEQITIKTTAGLSILLSDSDKLIQLKSQKHTIKMDDAGNVVSVDTPGDFLVKATGSVKIEGTAGMELKSTASMSIEGQTTNVKGTSLSLQGQGTAELKSSGVLTVQGTLVKIN